MPSPPMTRGRLRAFDALRAAGVVAGVLLHSAAAYMRAPMPDLLWTVQDPAPSAVFDVVFWWGRLVQPPLFFFVAGFFSAEPLATRSLAAFLAGRWRRVGRPLLLGGAIVLPLTYYVWAAGWLVAGRAGLRDVERLRFSDDIQRNLYGPAHLWFLQDLSIISLAAAATAALAGRARSPAGQRPAGGSPWLVLAFSVPAAALLLHDPRPVLAHPNTFVPDPMRLAHGAIYFAGGAWLSGRRARLGELARGHRLLLALSVPGPLFVAWVFGGGSRGSPPLAGSAVLGISLALTAWCAIVGGLGAAQRYAHAIGPRLQYLARASLWLYVVHLPIVGLVQVDLYRTSVPAPMKFATAAASAFALGLLTFELARRSGPAAAPLAADPAPARAPGRGFHRPRASI